MAQSKTLFEQRKASSLPAYLLLRIFFAACIVLGPLTHFVYAIFDPTSSPGRVAIAANIAANATTNQLHLAFGVAASFLLPISYVGMALLALRRAPWLGTISLLLALPGWTPLSGLIGLDALTYDMAQMGGGVQFAALWDRFNGDGVMVSYVVIYAICHLLCAVLVGIALGQARIIPIWAATSLVISSPLLIIGFPIHLTFYHSALLFGSLALLFIGSIPAALALLKRTGEGGSARADEE